jgi:hypothetical protein
MGVTVDADAAVAVATIAGRVNAAAVPSAHTPASAFRSLRKVDVPSRMGMSRANARWARTLRRLDEFRMAGRPRSSLSSANLLVRG